MITPYYLARFIDSGKMDARQILAERNIDDLPDREGSVAGRSEWNIVLHGLDQKWHSNGGV